MSLRKDFQISRNIFSCHMHFKTDLVAITKQANYGFGCYDKVVWLMLSLNFNHPLLSLTQRVSLRSKRQEKKTEIQLTELVL